MTTRGTGSQSQMSAFDENTLNHSQFIQLTETFLGDNPALEIFQILSRYLRDGYIETEEEKMARLMRVSYKMVLEEDEYQEPNGILQFFKSPSPLGTGWSVITWKCHLAFEALSQWLHIPVWQIKIQWIVSMILSRVVFCFIAGLKLTLRRQLTNIWKVY